MCNRYAVDVSYFQFTEHLKQTGLMMRAGGAIPNLEPRPNVRPTDKAPILRPTTEGLEVTEIRWGLIPWFHKGSIKEWKPLGTNARSENVVVTAPFKTAYKERRCLVPFNHFFEWTGEKGNKTMWRFKPKDYEFLCFAGIWDRATTTDGKIESFSLLTMAAGAEVQPYHDRQPVVFKPDQYEAWLNKEEITFSEPSLEITENLM